MAYKMTKVISSIQYLVRLLMLFAPQAKLTSTMGHRITSNLGHTVYQPDDRPLDLVARRFDEPESATHLALQDFHSSVAYNSDAPPPLLPSNDSGDAEGDIQDDDNGVFDAIATDKEYIRRHTAWQNAEAPLASLNGGKYTYQLDEEVGCLLSVVFALY